MIWYELHPNGEISSSLLCQFPSFTLIPSISWLEMVISGIYMLFNMKGLVSGNQAPLTAVAAFDELDTPICLFGTTVWYRFHDPISVWDDYHLVMTNSLPWKMTMLLIGKPSINGPFSMAMLDNQRVYLYIYIYWLVVTGTWMDYDFPYIGNVMIPTDFHIFQRGRYTTNQINMFFWV